MKQVEIIRVPSKKGLRVSPPQFFFWPLLINPKNHFILVISFLDKIAVVYVQM